MSGLITLIGGRPGGRIDAYSFAGDGTVSLDEWAAGTLFHSFTDIGGGYATLSVDITTLVKIAVLADSSYLSFGLRTTEDDRFWLNSTIDGVTRSFSGESPTTITIAVVPEPKTYAMLLAGLGLVGFVARSARNQKMV
jgi:hypothetical protein